MIFWITLDVGLLLGWYLCSKRVPKFKTGVHVVYRDANIYVEIKHIRWSTFHRQWTYYVIGHGWDGYLLAKDLKKCRQ